MSVTSHEAGAQRLGVGAQSNASGAAAGPSRRGGWRGRWLW